MGFGTFARVSCRERSADCVNCAALRGIGKKGLNCFYSVLLPHLLYERVSVQWLLNAYFSILGLKKSIPKEKHMQVHAINFLVH